MDAIFYNNYIARILRILTGRGTFAIGPFILTTMSQGCMGTRTYNRIYTYTRQWTEMTLISFFISVISCILFTLDLGWIALSPITYYIWYIIEYFIKCSYNFLTEPSIFDYDTTDDMSYHIEAEIAAFNPHYYEEDRFFSWVKFIVRRY